MKPITTYVRDDMRGFSNQFSILAFTNRWSAEEYCQDHDAHIISRAEARRLASPTYLQTRDDYRRLVACYVGSRSKFGCDSARWFEAEANADALAYDGIVGLCYPAIRL